MCTFIRPFHPDDTEPVVDLWHKTGLVHPNNNPYLDIARKLETQPELFFIASGNPQLIGTVMAGYEGHRGWINYLAVHPDHQSQGIARQLMQHAESALRQRNCPKINLQVRTSNAQVLAFYQALGYIPDNVVSLGKRLSPDG